MRVEAGLVEQGKFLSFLRHIFGPPRAFLLLHRVFPFAILFPRVMK